MLLTDGALTDLKIPVNNHRYHVTTTRFSTSAIPNNKVGLRECLVLSGINENRDFGALVYSHHGLSRISFL
jgi:hypothetical protein